MNILLFHPNKTTLEMISFCLETRMGLLINRAATFQEAMDYLLEDTHIDLIITSLRPETDKIFKYLLSTTAGIPLILIRESDQAQLTPYPDIQVLGSLDVHDIPEKLIPLVHSNFTQAQSSAADEEFCRIKTDLLVRVAPLRGDIYIRLSSVKYVKLFRTGMNFTGQDLEKFLNKKKVNFLYIRKSDSAEFVARFKEDLAELVKQAKPEDEHLFATVSEVQEQIQDLALRLGFTKEVRELAHQNIDLALTAIGSSPKLSKVLGNSQLRSKNFISSHSMLLAHVSCSIAAQMQWPSNTTFQKLTMAALFHDFTFADPELAKISSKKQLEDLKLKPTDEVYLSIKNHPLKAAEIVKTLNEVPGDVDVIVAQHHERGDGTGFPKGIRAHQIAPLSAVLIVAHDILDCAIAEQDNFELKVFLRRTEADYQGSVFRKVWKALSASQNGGSEAA